MTVGVLGGMGPAATVDFFARVVRATPAATEQDHLHLIIDNNPGVPDRNRGVAGTGPSPGPALAAMARRLETAGADFIVMPCNTAHAFVDDIRAATRVPFIDMIDETVRAVGSGKPERVGLLATDGCLSANLYQHRLAAIDCTSVLLNPQEQQAFMQLLYRIKGGNAGPDSSRLMTGLAGMLVSRGAQVLVAACTEVPLVMTGVGLDVPFVESTEVLVARTVERAMGL
jgi:aspartate racemase